MLGKISRILILFNMLLVRGSCFCGKATAVVLYEDIDGAFEVF